VQQDRRGQAAGASPQGGQQRARRCGPGGGGGGDRGDPGAAGAREPVGWRPVFAIVLAGLWLAFRRVER
jgi:hypothetical protein